MRTWTNPYYTQLWVIFWKHIQRQARHERNSKLLDYINNTTNSSIWLSATSTTIGLGLTINDVYWSSSQ
jgi:hypothetical protein